MVHDQVTLGLVSRVGGRDRNEDACGYWGTQPLCCALADGAGGHGGGDIAARAAVRAVLESFAIEPTCSPQRALALIHRANSAVLDAQREDPEHGDMRATLVLLALDPASDLAVWAHIGDSRLYLFRDGHLHLQTRDHSLYQSLVDAGFADPESRRGNPQRNVLTGSLGIAQGFQPEITEDAVRAEPGDAFLLCSDGFWEFVDEAMMEGMLQRAGSAQAWLDDMAELVARKGGARQDNYSAIAVWYGPMDFSTLMGAAAASGR